MVITTRGGVARVLEYDKNYGLIAKTESDDRIAILSIVSSAILIILLQFLLILSFNYGHRQLILDAAETPSPIYQTYMISVTKDGNVYVSPPVIQSNYLQIMSFEKNDWEKKWSLKNLTGFHFIYEFQDLVYYLYSRYDNEFSTLRIPNYSKFKNKYFVEEQDQNHFYVSYEVFTPSLGRTENHPYKLPKNVSWVNVGEFIWFFGNELQMQV